MGCEAEAGSWAVIAPTRSSAEAAALPGAPADAAAPAAVPLRFIIRAVAAARLASAPLETLPAPAPAVPEAVPANAGLLLLKPSRPMSPPMPLPPPPVLLVALPRWCWF